MDEDHGHARPRRAVQGRDPERGRTQDQAHAPTMTARRRAQLGRNLLGASIEGGPGQDGIAVDDRGLGRSFPGEPQSGVGQ